ncbi:MAG: RsmF rRNA methyltransferase first C-terminal domain-containing protein, partial [Longicatena sp.]
EVLCKEMKGCFDRVLVDAPCSGEGMFKKHSKAMEDWSVEHVHACAMRQLHILDSAYMALKEDGILVYSTCTYSMEENEEVIAQFLKNYPDMQLIDPEVSFGRSGLAYEDLDTKKLIRILPMDKGEGHFVAKLKKKGKSESTKLQVASNDILPPYVKEFLQTQLTNIPPYHILLRDKLYIKQRPFVLLKKTKILRQGTLVGELVKNRIEPHQHFYTSSVYEEAYQNVYDMSEEECLSYVKGNLLQVPGYKGYTCLTWKHHPIAYAKGDGVVLKNKYPKGMRVKGI